jgi:hypothetical protein
MKRKNLRRRSVSLESTPESNLAKAQKVSYTNDIGNEPIRVDMSKQAPLHPPHDHEYEHNPNDADSSWATVLKCKHCDHGRLTAK